MDRPVILVVEDEPLLNMAAVDMFEAEGHVVHAAFHADEAWHLLESLPRVDVLFTDDDMPAGSVDGLVLVRRACGRWPELRVVVASGRRQPDEGLLPEGCLFFGKPYREQVVVETVRKLIARP